LGGEDIERLSNGVRAWHSAWRGQNRSRYHYQGAYIFRLGFDHAYGQRYGSLFALEQVPKLPILAVRNDQPDAVFQVAFTFDWTNTRWEILRVRGVVVSQQDVTATSPHTSWDFATCARANNWVPEQTGGVCEPGRGWILTPGNGVVKLRSPALELPVGWTEVLVDMETGADTGVEATAQLWWSTTGSGAATDRPVELNVLAGRHSYVLFLPPDATRKPIAQVRLVAQGLVSDVTVRRIVMRPIP
jgi:hypothetical protein